MEQAAEELNSRKSRGWCFTLNHPTDDEIETLNVVDCSYICYGRETGAAGNAHLQGYIRFSNARVFRSVKSIIGRWHLEPQRGTTAQAIAYCKKEDNNPYTRGEEPCSQETKGAMEKERFKRALGAAKEGKFDDIDPDIFFRFYRTCKEIRKDHSVMPPDVDGVCGVWYYGASGVGKSRTARATYPNFYAKLANKWWDGFQPDLHEFVILDDLDLLHDKLGHHLKIWSDRYAFSAETKGGMLSIRPKKIVITSQYRIEDIFQDNSLIEALNRRFEVINLV